MTPAFRVQQANRDFPGKQGLPVLSELPAPRDWKVLKDLKAPKAPKEKEGRKDYKGSEALLG